MKKYICTLAIILGGTALFADYALLPLPKESELNDPRKFYDAGVAAYTIPAEECAKYLGAIVGAKPEDLQKMLANKNDAGKAQKFLKLAKIGKGAKTLGVKFGKYKVILFEIPAGSRMRKGMNYIALETAPDGGVLWNVGLNDMFLALMARCDFANPKPMDIARLQTLSASDKALLNRLAKDGQPVLAFTNGALVSADAAGGVYEEPAAKFYAKIQKVFFSWQLDKYASFMSQKSAEKFRAQYAGMTPEQKKKTLEGYFAWKKKYLKVMGLSDSEFLVVFKRYKDGQPDQFDTAYITLEAKDGSAGKLEKFGERTPLDLMLARYIFKNKARAQ